jgi:hypothetical protein
MFIAADLSETVGHPDGPCIMFYRLFELLERHSSASILALPGNELAALKERQRRKKVLGISAADTSFGFDHFMLMETDVFPIRKHWVYATVHASL